MNKFSVGDKVVLVKENDWALKDGLKLGGIYTVNASSKYFLGVKEGKIGYSIPCAAFKKINDEVIYE